MPTNIDETELARLEALAGKASTLPFEDMAADGWGYVVVDILPAVTSAVPALVAEVRRLLAEVKQGSADYCALMDKHDAQFVRAEKLREEVNWLAKMCATHCRDKSFDNAQCSIQDCAPLHCYHASAEQWKEAALEASEMLAAGADLAAVAAQMGHASIQTTATTYAHVTPGGQKCAADLLPSLVQFGAEKSSHD